MPPYAYSPETGELILTDRIAEWMGVTDQEPPDFNPSVQGCFWRDDRWEIVDSVIEKPNSAAVTPWQIRKALNQLGLRTSVEAAVAAADQETKDGWEFAQEFRRDNPLIASLGVALGKTDAEIDALFDLAGSL